jgi:WD40 repeat protein
MGHEQISGANNSFSEFDRSRLLLAMKEAFSEEDLRTLCFELGIVYDDLPPGGRADRARELIILCQRTNRFEQLLQICQQRRPLVDWWHFIRQPDESSAPYKGLIAFDQEDAGIFFGRETLTTELVNYLQKHQFLAVVGASGSGKSSLVRAGLLPILNGTNSAGAEVNLPSGCYDWPVHIITPTSKPLESLAISLTRDSESVTAIDTLTTDFLSLANKRSLHLYVSRLVKETSDQSKSSDRLLLVVDQFEELFTLCRDETERRAFIENLTTAVDPALGGPTTVIITLRADFYAHCADYEPLRQALESGQKFIGRMTTDELRRVITEPARTANLHFQEGLVELMLRDIGAGQGQELEPGALPLLAHALRETWERREGNKMTLAGYQDSGGVMGAIALTADRTYQDLAEEEQAIARNIFLRLIEPGEGTQDTRRRVGLDEMMLPSETLALATEVLRKLTGARLLTTSDGSVELAHEALMREWPALRSWLDQNRESLRLHVQLGEAAREWERSQEQTDFLWLGYRLARVEAWIDDEEPLLTQLETRFLAAGRQEEERRHNEELAQQFEREKLLREHADAEQRRAETEAKSGKRFRIFSAILLVFLVLAVAAIIIAASQQNVIQARALAFAARNQIDNDPETALLLAIEAVNRHTDYEIEGALRESLESFTWRSNNLLGHEDRIVELAYAPNDQLVLSASLDGTARLWNRDGQPLTLFKGHEAPLTSIAFSPDSRNILTASEDGTARLWNLEGQNLAMFEGHEDEVFMAIFSPDGKHILTASADGTARLWNLEGELITSYDEHEDEVNYVAFNPEGDLVLTASSDSTARLWDLDGVELARFEGHESDVFSAEFSPESNRILTLSDDETARLWDIDGRQLASFIQPDFLRNAIFSPDGQHVLTSGGPDYTLTLWDLEGSILSEFHGHTRSVRDLGFSNDGQKVISTADDGTVKLWNLDGQLITTFKGHDGFGDVGNRAIFNQTGEIIVTSSANNLARYWEEIGPPLAHLIGHEDKIETALYSPDGEKILTTSDDNTARLWDRDGEQLLVFSEHEAAVEFAEFSPDGQWVLSSSDDGTARLWDLNGNEGAVFEGHEGEIGMVRLDPSVKWVATVSDDGTARLWELNGNLIAVMEGHEDEVEWIEFSPDSEFVLTASDDGTARLWDLTGEEIISFEGHEDSVERAVFSPDGQQVLTSSQDGTARLWDLTGQTLTIIDEHEDEVLGAEFSPNGEKILTFSRDDTARLWDLDGKPVATMIGHAGPVTEAIFSPDGQLILTASDDRTARLWNLEGKQVANLNDHADRVSKIAFSPDGRRLITGSTDRTVHQHYVNIDELLASAVCRVGRELSDEEIEQFGVGQPEFALENRNCS